MARFGRSYTHSRGRVVSVQETIQYSDSVSVYGATATASRSFGGPEPWTDDSAYECTWGIARKGIALGGFFWWSNGNGVEWNGGPGTCPTVIGPGSLEGINGTGYVGWSFRSNPGFPAYSDLYPTIYAGAASVLAPSYDAQYNTINDLADSTFTSKTTGLTGQEIGYEAVPGAQKTPANCTVNIKITGSYQEIPIVAWYMPLVDDGGSYQGGFYLSATGAGVHNYSSFIGGPTGDMFAPSVGTYLGTVNPGGVDNIFDITPYLPNVSQGSTISNGRSLGLIYLIHTESSTPAFRCSSGDEFFAKQSNGITVESSVTYELDCYAVEVKQENYTQAERSGITIVTSKSASSVESPQLTSYAADGSVVASASYQSLFGTTSPVKYAGCVAVRNSDVLLAQGYYSQTSYYSSDVIRQALIRPTSSGFQVISKGGFALGGASLSGFKYNGDALYMNGNVYKQYNRYGNYYGFNTNMTTFTAYAGAYAWDTLSDFGYAFYGSSSSLICYNLRTYAQTTHTLPVTASGGQFVASSAGTYVLLTDTWSSSATKWALVDFSSGSPVNVSSGDFPDDIAGSVSNASGSSLYVYARLIRTPNGYSIIGNSLAYNDYPTAPHPSVNIYNYWMIDFNNTMTALTNGRVISRTTGAARALAAGNSRDVSVVAPAGLAFLTSGNAEVIAGAQTGSQAALVGASGSSGIGSLSPQYVVTASHQGFVGTPTFLGLGSDTKFERFR